MKMCKKGIAWILALMLVLSMAPSVFAAEGDERRGAPDLGGQRVDRHLLVAEFGEDGLDLGHRFVIGEFLFIHRSIVFSSYMRPPRPALRRRPA